MVFNIRRIIGHSRNFIDALCSLMSDNVPDLCYAKPDAHRARGCELVRLAPRRADTLKKKFIVRERARRNVPKPRLLFGWAGGHKWTLIKANDTTSLVWVGGRACDTSIRGRMKASCFCDPEEILSLFLTIQSFPHKLT